MARMNHARVNMRQRIFEQNKWYNRPQEDASYSPAPPRYQNVYSWDISTSRWESFGFKRCRGESAAWIFFEDIQFFRWLVRDDIPLRNLPKEKRARLQRQKQMRDLMKVANRAKRIKLPFRERYRGEFVWVVDRDGIFERVVIAPKGERIKFDRGSREVMRTSILDVTLVVNFAEPDTGFRRMIVCVKDLFDVSDNYEWFFDKESHFDMNGIRTFE